MDAKTFAIGAGTVLGGAAILGGIVGFGVRDMNQATRSNREIASIVGEHACESTFATHGEGLTKITCPGVGDVFISPDAARAAVSESGKLADGRPGKIDAAYASVQNPYRNFDFGSSFENTLHYVSAAGL